MKYLSRVTVVSRSCFVYQNTTLPEAVTETYVKQEHLALSKNIQRFAQRKKEILTNSTATDQDKLDYLQTSIPQLRLFIRTYVPDHISQLGSLADDASNKTKKKDAKQALNILQKYLDEYKNIQRELGGTDPELHEKAEENGMSVEFYVYLTNNGKLEALPTPDQFDKKIIDLTGTNITTLNQYEYGYINQISSLKKLDLGDVKTLENENLRPLGTLPADWLYSLLQPRMAANSVFRAPSLTSAQILDFSECQAGTLIDFPSLTEENALVMNPAFSLKYQTKEAIRTYGASSTPETTDHVTSIYFGHEITKIAATYPTLTHSDPIQLNPNEKPRFDFGDTLAAEATINTIYAEAPFESIEFDCIEIDGVKTWQMVRFNGVDGADAVARLHQIMSLCKNGCKLPILVYGQVGAYPLPAPLEVNFEFEPVLPTISPKIADATELLKLIFTDYDNSPDGTSSKNDLDIDDVYWFDQTKEAFGLTRRGWIASKNGPDDITNYPVSKTVVKQFLTDRNRSWSNETDKEYIKELLSLSNENLSWVRLVQQLKVKTEDSSEEKTEHPWQSELFHQDFLAPFATRNGYQINTPISYNDDKGLSVSIQKYGRSVLHIKFEKTADSTVVNYSNYQPDNFVPPENLQHKSLKILPNILDIIDDDFDQKKINTYEVCDEDRPILTNMLTTIFDKYVHEETRSRCDLDSDDIDWATKGKTMFVFENGCIHADRNADGIQNKVLTKDELQALLGSSYDLEENIGKHEARRLVDLLNQNMSTAQFIKDIKVQNPDERVSAEDDPDKSWALSYQSIVPYLLGRSGYTLGEVSASLPSKYEGCSHYMIKKNNTEVLRLMVKNDQILAFDMNKDLNFVPEDDGAPGKKSQWVGVSRLTDYLDTIDAVIDRGEESHLMLQLGKHETQYVETEMMSKINYGKLVRGLEKMHGSDTKYFEAIQKLCRDQAPPIPENFVYIPLVESYYAQGARSATGAKGPWQFSGSTAEEMNLSDPDNYSLANQKGVEYCATIYNNYLDPSKFTEIELGAVDRFKFSCLAYNLGPSAIHLWVKELGGDFSKFLDYLEKGNFDSLKAQYKTLAASNETFKGIQFPSSSKLKEIRDYVYRMYAIKKMTEAYKNGPNIKRSALEHQGKSVDLVQVPIRRGDTLWNLYEAYEIYDDTDYAFFKKLNDTDETKVYIDKSVVLPIKVVELVPNPNGNNQYSTFFGIAKKNHQLSSVSDAISALFEYNKAVNPAFAFVTDVNHIPAHTPVWVSLSASSKSDNSDEESVPSPDEKEEGEPEMVGTISPDNFGKWDESIEVKKQTLKKICIVLDPGHGGQERKDFTAADKKLFSEHELVYDVTMRLYKILKENGASVKTTIIDGKPGNQITKGDLSGGGDKREYYGDGDRQPINQKSRYKGYLTHALTHRKKIANKFYAQESNKKKTTMFLSIHADAINKSLSGFHVYGDHGKGSITAADKKLEKELVKSFRKENFPILNNPIRRDGLRVMNHKGVKHKAGAKALLEIGNMYHQGDVAKFRDPLQRQKMAQTIFDAIKTNYGIK